MKIYGTQGELVLDVEVDDNSYRNRVIMGDHNLMLYFSLAEHVEIPLGSYCEFESERYTLMRPESLKMKHSRYFEYTVKMEAYDAKAKIWMFRNTVDGRLKFPLTAKPHEHLQMFVDNMNRRDSGWTIGRCVEGAEVLITYDHNKCYDALGLMAQQLNTEFEIIGKTVSLGKIEYNKSNPLPLSYGKGNGFKPDVGRTNSSETPPVEILFVQGGDRNIDPSNYDNRHELHMPKSQSIGYDGEHFEDEHGFSESNARYYITDDDGLSLRRVIGVRSYDAEDSLDCTEIYPKRVGTVSGVVVVDSERNFYDIVDNGIPSTLDYSECLIQGETMTVQFQSGMLAGREFDVSYFHESEGGKNDRRFEIVPAEIDGMTMPNSTFAPAVGDKYVVFNCMLPDAYICDNATKSGAEWDMFRTAVKYMFDNEVQKFTFKGELDGIWAKKDWVNIGGRIILGGYIRFHDERFQQDGVLVRIIGIKDYINTPHSPVIELSNETVTPGFNSEINELQGNEVLIQQNYNSAIQFTKRRFRDAKETMSLLEEALLTNFTESISPIAIQTMQLLAGDDSLQFRFVNNTTNPSPVVHNVTYNSTTKQLSSPAGIIQHMTLGIANVSNAHDVSEYKFWNIPLYTSAVLTDADTSYYLYAKVSKTAQTGEFLLSDTAIALEGVGGYYHLLVGILNSEFDGERSYVDLYGFTEILPGRITTDMIVSADGNTYFDLVNSVIRGKITFLAGSSGYNNIIDTPDLSHYVKDTDGLVEVAYGFDIPTASNLPASQWTDAETKRQHVGDLYRRFNEAAKPPEPAYTWYRYEQYNKTQRVDGADVQVSGHRWSRISPVPEWFRHIRPATRMFMGIEPFPPYSVDDIWMNGGIFQRCVTAKSAGMQFNDADFDGELYDNTRTTIDGGIVTSGTVRLAGDDSHIKAGITGSGTADTSVRIWAGATEANKASAPFRVTQGGKMFAENAEVRGKITATDGVFYGSLATPAQTIPDNSSSMTLSFDNGFNFAGKLTTASTKNIILPDDVKYAGVELSIVNYGSSSNGYYNITNTTLKGFLYAGRRNYYDLFYHIQLYGCGILRAKAYNVDGTLRWFVENYMDFSYNVVSQVLTNNLPSPYMRCVGIYKMTDKDTLQTIMCADGNTLHISHTDTGKWNLYWSKTRSSHKEYSVLCSNSGEGTIDTYNITRASFSFKFFMRWFFGEQSGITYLDGTGFMFYIFEMDV